MKKVYSAAVIILLVGTVLFLVTGCSPKAPAQARLRLEVTAPATRATVTDPIVTVSGIVSESSAKVTVKDTPVQVAANGAFSYPVPLNYGSNSIIVRATLEGQNPLSRTLTITRNLVLDVSTPLDKGLVSEDIITVAGKVSDTAAKLYINGTEIVINEDGSFSSPVQLYYATTTINISTVLDGVEPITKLVTVTKAL